MTILDVIFNRHRDHPDRSSLILAEAIIHLAQSTTLLMTSVERLTKATTDNTAAITALTKSVDAAVADLQQGSAGDAQLDALAGAIEANNTNLAAQQARLDEAVNPTPPPAPAPVV